MPHPRERESDVLRTVRDYLKVHRIFHMRINVGSAMYGKQFVYFGTVGAPDLFAVYHGQALALECKAPKGVQRESQIAFQQEFEHAGGIYRVIRSVEDVTGVLRYVEGRWEEKDLARVRATSKSRASKGESDGIS